MELGKRSSPFDGYNLGFFIEEMANGEFKKKAKLDAYPKKTRIACI